MNYRLRILLIIAECREHDSVNYSSQGSKVAKEKRSEEERDNFLSYYPSKGMSGVARK